MQSPSFKQGRWKLKGQTHVESWAKAKRDHQGWVYLGKMVLMVVRRGGWTVWAAVKRKPRGPLGLSPLRYDASHGSQAGKTGLCERWPKKAKKSQESQGGPPSLSPLKLDDSHGGQAGRLDCVSSSQRQTRESWPVRLCSQGKLNGQTDSPTGRDNLLFFRGVIKRLYLLQMKMLRWEPQICVASEYWRFFCLNIELIVSLTTELFLQEGRLVLSWHYPCDRWGGAGNKCP